ncbi:MAG: hypothetical protein AAGE96_26140 [Cyanobacteria bacterium P01_G01_bin.19]
MAAHSTFALNGTINLIDHSKVQVPQKEQIRDCYYLAVTTIGSALQTEPMVGYSIYSKSLVQP